MRQVIAHERKHLDRLVKIIRPWTREDEARDRADREAFARRQTLFAQVYAYQTAVYDDVRVG